jgi:hypothetical protein
MKKRMFVTNTLAYYVAVLITKVESIIVQASDVPLHLPLLGPIL